MPQAPHHFEEAIQAMVAIWTGTATAWLVKIRHRAVRAIVLARPSGPLPWWLSLPLRRQHEYQILCALSKGQPKCLMATRFRLEPSVSGSLASTHSRPSRCVRPCPGKHMDAEAAPHAPWQKRSRARLCLVCPEVKTHLTGSLPFAAQARSTFQHG